MTYTTYQFFNKKNNRLAIFGETIGSNITITIIPCSTKDHFSKKKARQLYQDIKDGKTVYYETHVCKGLDHKDFMRWCRNNFYKKVYIVSDETSEIVKYKPKTGTKPSKIEIIYNMSYKKVN